MLLIDPGKKFQLVYYPKIYLVVTNLVAITVSAGVGLFFYLTTPDKTLGILVLLYYILGMGPLVALAYLRIGYFNEELVSGTALTFSGFLFFNFSDTLLFLSLVSPVIPVNWSFLSNNFYWLAMYLVAISVARKKLVFNLYLQNEILDS
jgi:hypothetical protein